MDATHQLIEKIVAMRNEARQRVRYWGSQKPLDSHAATRIDYYSGIRAEHNIVLMTAQDLGLVPDSMNLWDGE